MDNIFLIIIAAFLIWLAIKILKKPIKLLFKILMNSALGFVMLVVLNYIGSMFGIGIELTFINALIAGLLGIPGIALLFVINYLL